MSLVDWLAARVAPTESNATHTKTGAYIRTRDGDDTSQGGDNELAGALRACAALARQRGRDDMAGTLEMFAESAASMPATPPPEPERPRHKPGVKLARWRCRCGEQAEAPNPGPGECEGCGLNKWACLGPA